VGQKLIFEYSGYALHSGYANVYWSAIVRLGLLFPSPPRSRGSGLPRLATGVSAAGTMGVVTRGARARARAAGVCLHSIQMLYLDS